MRIEHRPVIIIEDLADLDKVDFEVPEGKPFPHLEFEVFDDVSEYLHDTPWDCAPEFLETPSTSPQCDTRIIPMKAAPNECLSPFVKMGAIISQRRYAPAIAEAMARARGRRMPGMADATPEHIVYVSCWPPTLRCGVVLSKVSEAGYFATNTQARVIMERAVELGLCTASILVPTFSERNHPCSR